MAGVGPYRRSLAPQRRDFYVAHNKPKRLFARELVRNARRNLQAEHFNALPNYRSRAESYPH